MKEQEKAQDNLTQKRGQPIRRFFAESPNIHLVFDCLIFSSVSQESGLLCSGVDSLALEKNDRSNDTAEKL